jgi:hypothetical protein
MNRISRTFLISYSVSLSLNLILYSQNGEEVIFEENFEQGLNHWKVEDHGKHHLVEVVDGQLIITNRTETPGIFVWNTVDLPQSFRLEFDFCPLGRGTEEKGFFLLFLAARGLGGTDILQDSLWSGSELQDFKKYTQGNIRCYHIGYLRGRTGLCNLRKNPGLSLVNSNSVPVLQEGETYRVVVEKRKARITMRINGPQIDRTQAVFQDWTDPSNVLNGGHFAFRQIAYDEGVKGAYDNVKLTALD